MPRSGYGKVAADVFSLHDPCYDASLHRERDIEQAKFVLKKAGHLRCGTKHGG